jgi:hypothetical protein
LWLGTHAAVSSHVIQVIAVLPLDCVVCLTQVLHTSRLSADLQMKNLDAAALRASFAMASPGC